MPYLQLAEICWRCFAKLLSKTESRANARPATRDTKEETDWKDGWKPETISPISSATLRRKLAYLKSALSFQMRAHLQFAQEDSGLTGISKSLRPNPEYEPLLAKIRDDMTSIEQARMLIEHYMEYFEQESEKEMTEDDPEKTPEKMEKSFSPSDDAVRHSLLK